MVFDTATSLTGCQLVDGNLFNRNWAQFHTPRNLSLALCGEVGELCELFQFKNEDDCCAGLLGWTKEARDKLSQVQESILVALWYPVTSSRIR